MSTEKMSRDKAKRPKQVAALKYVPEEDQSPRIVALGSGEIAERILEKAKENNVPVYENAGLAETLNTLSLGDEIPAELYEVIAEILVFVSTIDRGYGDKYGKYK
ncbi:EscU/YscU/HrcU family type III secretion system export apparatus switch protein [Anaerobacterium chartisolvens]|nr:EscU/YscU/HrcU family type III secretion system export apparatus switch protein [Anaerobacterium chartisolvens]